MAKWVRKCGRGTLGIMEAEARGTERAADLCSMQIPFDRSV